MNRFTMRSLPSHRRVSGKETLNGSGGKLNRTFFRRREETKRKQVSSFITFHPNEPKIMEQEPPLQEEEEATNH
jgi:hypothetical protein